MLDQLKPKLEEQGMSIAAMQVYTWRTSQVLPPLLHTAKREPNSSSSGANNETVRKASVDAALVVPTSAEQRIVLPSMVTDWD